MEFGLTLPQSADMELRRDVPLVAREAEAAGYASLWVYERVLFPVEPTEGLYGMPGVPWLDVYRYTAEPLTVLTIAGAVTERITLGTCVLVAGLHSAHRLARTLATLDRATGGGRLIAGLGGGWSSDEFRASGAEFAHRGRSLDETMAALRALWAADPVSYHDSRMRVDNALVSPKPAGPIPILLGGGYSAKAVDRIARTADGWIPAGVPAARLAGQWRTIRELAQGHGRDPDALRLLPLLHTTVTDTPAGADRQPYQGSIAQVVEDIAELAAIGVGEAIIALRGLGGGPDVVARATGLRVALAEAGLG